MNIHLLFNPHYRHIGRQMYIKFTILQFYALSRDCKFVFIDFWDVRYSIISHNVKVIQSRAVTHITSNHMV
jgi:hypothetical protein